MVLNFYAMRSTQLAPAGLALKVFLALLPYLLSLMGRIQGLHSISSLDFSVVSKFYIFQVQLCSCPLASNDGMQELSETLSLPMIAW